MEFPSLTSAERARLAALGVDAEQSFEAWLLRLSPEWGSRYLWSQLVVELSARPSPFRVPLAVVIPASVTR